MSAFVYVGTYTDQTTPSGERSRGIYSFRMHANGRMDALGSVAHGDNPSYLIMAKRRRILYAVSELNGQAAITAYAMQPDGSLRALGSAAYPGSAMCHLAIDAQERFLLAANYLSGTVLSVALTPEGLPGALCANIQHAGRALPDKQPPAPHAHSAQFLPGGPYVVAADLGTDTLYTYRMDEQTGALHAAGEARVPHGQGPRHFVLDAQGTTLYLLTELGNRVMRFACAPETGTLTFLDEMSSLPASFAGKSSGADIHLSPDGRFLYASNRGSDTLLCAATGAQGLHDPSWYSCGGRVPRNFALTQDGGLLLTANQNSHNIAVLARDAQTGSVARDVSGVPVPFPVCLVIVPEEALVCHD